MSFKVGNLVKLHLGDRWHPRAMAVSKPLRTARLAKWRGEVTALHEVWLEGWKGGEKLAHVEPPIIWRPGKEGSWDTMCVETLGSAALGEPGRRRPTLKTRRCAVDPDTGDVVMPASASPVDPDTGDVVMPASASLPLRRYTIIPVGWLEMAERPKRPKNAAKGRTRKKGAEWKATRQETLKTIELQKDDEDDAWFLDARGGELGDADADFHDVAEHTREKTLSAAVQSDLAQARSKRKGGRGRRRRRKRTRRTRRRKKRRTRRRRRKRTRRRRRR